MLNDKIDVFVNEVGSRIRWKKARPEVVEELREHIIDLRDSLIKQGLDEDAASIKAIEQTGSAKEIGKELNRANRPAPEWAKGNNFLKSILRQPWRSMLLFLLIAAAAFSFVLRTTEFFTVRGSIFDAAGFYRSIGFIRVHGEPYGNVSPAAEIIGASSFVDYEDRQRKAEALLHDLKSPQIAGIFDRHTDTARENRFHYAYFYGTLTLIRSSSFRGEPLIQLVVNVDDVLLAFPEHIVPGQELRLELFLEDGPNPLEGMVVGERYFLRAALYDWFSLTDNQRHNLPREGFNDTMHIKPLNDYGLWYVPVPEGGVDFSMPDLEGLEARIEQSRRNHHTVWLQTTSDMQNMPMMHELLNSAQLVQGRLLNRQDYLEARPVAVISHQLARVRGVSVGDTITVSVPANQRILGSFWNFVIHFEPIRIPDGWDSIADFLAVNTEFFVQGDSGEYMMRNLELEVVGTVIKWPFQHVIGQTRLWSNFIYIPDSLLPPDYMPIAEYHGYSDYIWDTWYSFVLRDSRDESAFILENRTRLEEMGFELVLIPAGSENFWQSAEPVLLSIAVNAVLFILVLFLVIGLVTYIYLYQRRRDFAISRALGEPAKKTVSKLCSAMLVLSLPAALLGGFAGWLIALRTVENIMRPIVEAGYEYMAEFSVPLLFLQICVVVAIVITILFIGALRTSKRPVLELLQGQSGKRQRS